MSALPVSDIAFTPAVKAIQERKGSRRGYTRMDEKGGWADAVDPDLAAFIAERDSFYLATATADGQPYIQHRGGRPGFLKVLDAHTLAFADFTQVDLAFQVSPFSGLAEPLNRLGVVLGHAPSFVVHDPNSKLGFDVSLPGESRKPGERRRVVASPVGLGGFAEGAVGGIRETGRQRHTQRDNQSDPSHEPFRFGPRGRYHLRLSEKCFRAFPRRPLRFFRIQTT